MSATEYRLAIVIEAFAQQGDPVAAICPIIDSRLDPAGVFGVDVHYRRDTDTAIVMLRIDQRAVLGRAVELLASALSARNFGLVDLERIDPVLRTKFIEGYLSRQSDVYRDLPSASDAVAMLANQLGIALSRPAEAKTARLRVCHSATWSAARLWRMTSDGALIATAAPPRIGDKTRLSIEINGHHVEVDAVATRHTAPHAASAMGVHGFAARFCFDSISAHRSLMPLLSTVARTLTGARTPPRRRHSRFPVRWRGQVLSGERVVSRVVDISAKGLQIEHHGDTLPDLVDLAIAADNEGSPLRLRGRVARIASEDLLERPRLLGFEIEQADERFSALVERISQRTTKRLLVAASGIRLNQLSHELAGHGYMVSAAGGAQEIYSRVTEHRDPPDLILIDESLSDGNVSAARPLERALARQALPTYRISQAASGAEVRRLIDAAFIG